MRSSGLAALSITALLLSLPSPSRGRLLWSGAEAGTPRDCAPGGAVQSPKQPKVAPGPGEPDWEVILRERYGLSMFDDLKNPVKTTSLATPGLFRKAGGGPVRFRPVIALGLATKNRGGWYKALAKGADLFDRDALEA